MPDSTSLIALTRTQHESLVREAARAPSVHNVQPARWRFEPQGEIVLFRALDRTIPVADPSGQDVMASLGAAFEGMAIALSRLGLRLGTPIPDVTAAADGCAPVVRARVFEGNGPDRLARYVTTRRTHRGEFARGSSAARASLRVFQADDVRVVDEPRGIALLAERHDAATWRFESQRAYHAELWSWLRLSPGDPRYERDGLTADCLALSGVERVAARVLLHPAVFAVLGRLGLARHLVSERAQVCSATAVVLFAPRRSDPPFEVGRRFYRLWLEITAAGLHAAPMSASADDMETRALLTKESRLPADRRLANVLRVGRAPVDGVAESPRLPVGEMLV
jgi:hypothetical protein